MIKKLILLAILVILMIYMLQPLLSTFAGSHSIERIRNSSDYGASGICAKCHEEEVFLNNLSAHRNAGCICHGYSPSFTPDYNINVAHNLTKNLYCTNCHSDYNIEGKQEIYPGMITSNQSGHYIRKNSSIPYNHAQKFFSGG